MVEKQYNINIMTYKGVTNIVNLYEINPFALRMFVPSNNKITKRAYYEKCC